MTEDRPCDTRIDNRTRRRRARRGQAPPATFTAFGLAAEAEPLAPGLYVVATPIGNLGDMSFRALATLAAADAVLAEDTRVTRTLLAHYGITTPLVAYHEHSNAAVRERMIARIRDGQALALVSDAGTPLVSDPGYGWSRPRSRRASRSCRSRAPPRCWPPRRLGPADGPLLLRGLPAREVAAPRRDAARGAGRSARHARLYEAPHRLAEMLADAAAVLGPRGRPRSPAN